MLLPCLVHFSRANFPSECGLIGVHEWLAQWCFCLCSLQLGRKDCYAKQVNWYGRLSTHRVYLHITYRPLRCTPIQHRNVWWLQVQNWHKYAANLSKEATVESSCHRDCFSSSFTLKSRCLLWCFGRDSFALARALYFLQVFSSFRMRSVIIITQMFGGCGYNWHTVHITKDIL